MTILKDAVNDCAVLRASLFRRSNRTTEDALAIATAFALEAKHIFEHLGGPHNAAAQFYHLADGCVK